MPGLGSGLGIGGFVRPALERTFSFAGSPASMLSHTESNALSLATGMENEGTTTSPATPHEPLSLDWAGTTLELDLDDLAPFNQAGDSASKAVEEEPALLELAILPPLPLLPATAPSSAPVADAFITPPKKISTKQVKTVKAPRKKAPPKAASLDNIIATRAVPQTAPTRRISPEPVAPVEAATAPARQPARKKRRHMVQRPGTYQCMVQGELFDCPHGFDIVKKAFMYNVLGQLAGGSDQNAQ